MVALAALPMIDLAAANAAPAALADAVTVHLDDARPAWGLLYRALRRRPLPGGVVESLVRLIREGRSGEFHVPGLGVAFWRGRAADGGGRVLAVELVWDGPGEGGRS
jgi:hypothetical protein